MLALILALIVVGVVLYAFGIVDAPMPRLR